MREKWRASVWARDAAAGTAAERLSTIIEEGLAANASATEVVVYSAMLSSRGDGVCVLDGRIAEDGVHAILMKACSEAPWSASVLGDACVATSYSLDGGTYCVERARGGDARVACWDERCLQMVVDEPLGVAVSFQRREPRPPALFSSRAETHHTECVERLTVPISDSATLVIENASGAWMAKVVIKRRGATRAGIMSLAVVILAGSA